MQQKACYTLISFHIICVRMLTYLTDIINWIAQRPLILSKKIKIQRFYLELI